MSNADSLWTHDRTVRLLRAEGFASASGVCGELMVLAGWWLCAFVAPAPEAPYNLSITLMLVAAGGCLMAGSLSRVRGIEKQIRSLRSNGEPNG